MIRLTIRADTKDAEDLLDSAPGRRAIQAWAPASSIRGVGIMQEEIRTRTNTFGGTGQLREDIGAIQTQRGYAIVARAAHALFVDQGTRPHEIRPRNAKVLAFPRAGGLITRSTVGHVRTRFKYGGRTTFTSAVFRPLVHHPGTKPTNFARATAQRLAATEPAELEAALDRVLQGGTS